MADEITFDDCCRMILDDWAYRQDDAWPEWRDYFRHRLALLVQEFGIAWDDSRWSSDIGELAHVARSMPSTFSGIRSPTEGFLEYGFKPGEADVHDRHLEGIASAERELKQRWVAFFRDLLLLRWPEAADRTTSWSQLRALGLGEEPDTTFT